MLNKLRMLGRSVAANTNMVTTGGARSHSKAFLQNVNGDTAFSRALPKDFGQSKRTFVTEPTYKRLQEAIPERIDISEFPPYQEYGLCDNYAVDILAKRAREAHQADSTQSSTWGGFWDQVKKKIRGELKAEKLPGNGEELLAKFNEGGILTLRGPGLGENYPDHVILVFSVSKIDVPGKGPKIVVGAIDCNDQAADPETTASREAAAKMGKSHVSELTHEEANKNGAHLRRIRIMDGDFLVNSIRDRCFSTGCINLIGEGKMHPPEIIFPKKKLPTLTSDESAKLSQILVDIYDTPEVEKFENQDVSRVEQDAAAQRGMGGAMAQRLYKEAMKSEKSEQGE